MPDTTVVHLLRHGEVSNPDGILYGQLPGFHLSEEGRLMAKAAAGFLAGRDVAVLVTSPLERAQEKRKGGNRAFQRSLRHKQRMLMNPRVR